MTAGTHPLATHTMVGRDRELALIEQLRIDAGKANGNTLLLHGDGGVGKTRLVAELVQAAREQQWHVIVGRAYALETQIPYAPFADGCEPVLAAMDGNLLMRLTRGDQAVLTALAPSRADHHGASRDSGSSAAEQHVRLHAGIQRLFARLAEQRPMLLVLENLQWADASSLELLHFLARQAQSHRMLLVGTWNETERDLPDALRTMVRSLRSLGAARELHLEPLTLDAVSQLVAQRFEVDRESIATFVYALFDATRGNPFFVEQVLQDLVASGALRKSGNTWVGWHLEQIVLPRSVRDVLQSRLHRLSTNARRLAELIAVIGTTAEHEVLRRCAVQDDGTSPALATSADADVHLLSALDELRAQGIIIESMAPGGVSYELAHPLLRQALIEGVGLARERMMHARIAAALEAHHGDRAERYADQIAPHWRLADPQLNARHAVRWMLLAGRHAMSRLARREAALTLRAALDRSDEYPDLIDPDIVPLLLDELARLYRRLGEYTSAITMNTRARDLAALRGDTAGVAIAERRLGLAYEGLGRRADAVRHFDAGLASANQTGDAVLQARLRLAKADSLQALGLNDEARLEIAQALELAEQRNDTELLARAHRMLLKLHTWSGPVHRAWAHARAAVELATQSGARNLAWSAHWSAAVLSGFTCSINALREHLAQATRLADELQSPLLQLRTAEIAIEFYAGTGEWDRAIVEGERAIVEARALDQTSLLARLLYWVSGVYLYRGELAEAQRLVDEAWVVSGAATVDLQQPFEVHGVLPAYVARVMWLGAIGEHERAIELGRVAVATAERTGYVAWAVYRLLPAIAESAMAREDCDALNAVRSRLVSASAMLAHNIGRGWVSIIDGELAARASRPDAAIDAFQHAISLLEGVPFPFDAAKARLRLARVLQTEGRAAEASDEARAALEVFERLKAKSLVDETRSLLRNLGAKLPARRSAPGLIGLTGRELEIVRLVAKRLSNKEIGTQLEISTRTVGTHLANVFDKVGLRDRTALGDLAREHGLHK